MPNHHRRESQRRRVGDDPPEYGTYCPPRITRPEGGEDHSIPSVQRGISRTTARPLGCTLILGGMFWAAFVLHALAMTTGKWSTGWNDRTAYRTAPCNVRLPVVSLPRTGQHTLPGRDSIPHKDLDGGSDVGPV